MKESFSLFKTSKYEVFGEGDTDTELYTIKIVYDDKEFLFDLVTGEYLGNEKIIGIDQSTMDHVTKVLKLRLTDKFSLFQIAIEKINAFYTENVENWDQNLDPEKVPVPVFCILNSDDIETEEESTEDEPT